MRNFKYLICLLLCVLCIETSYAKKTEQKKNNSDYYVNPRGFAWGVDIGSTIEMTDNGFSTIDADACLGYKNSFLRVVGIGAGYHNSLENSTTFIPIYAVLRTNFTKRQTLCFLDLKGGYSLNNINGKDDQNGIYGSIGVGFNLYSNRKFKSHIILSYNYYQLKDYENDGRMEPVEDLHGASIKIGISF